MTSDVATPPRNGPQPIPAPCWCGLPTWARRARGGVATRTCPVRHASIWTMRDGVATFVRKIAPRKSTLFVREPVVLGPPVAPVAPAPKPPKTARDRTRERRDFDFAISIPGAEQGCVCRHVGPRKCVWCASIRLVHAVRADERESKK